MKEQKGTEKTAAILTINNAPNMDLEGRKMIARWARHQLNMFVKHGDAYAARFTARYLYQEGDYAHR